MGYKNLYGSDISEKAVSDTEKNLDWIISKYELEDISYKLDEVDARNISKFLDDNSIDVIATEPYLGKPLHGNESDVYLKNQSEELKKLYTDAFREFYQILKPEGIIIIAIPKFKTKNNWVEIDCIDDIVNLGFEVIPFEDEDYLLYHRPDQHLGREIWRFKKV